MADDTQTEIPAKDSQEDSHIVTDVKTYTEREAYLLNLNGDLPKGSIVVPDEKPTEEIVEDPTAPEEDNEEIEAEGTSAIPEGDTPKGSPEIETMELGGMKFRKEVDGEWEVLTKIDGEEEWIPNDKYQEGYQLTSFGRKEAEKNSKRSKELDIREERLKSQNDTDSFISNFLAPPKTDDVDADLDEEPKAPPSPPAAVTPEQIQALVAEGVQKVLQENKGVTDANAAYAQEVSINYNNTKELLKKIDVELPDEPTPKVRSTVIKYAELKGIDPGAVISSPVHFYEALKGFKVTTKSPPQPSADGVKKPPKTEGVKQHAEAGGQLTKLKKELKENLKRHGVDGVDSSEVDMKTMELTRQINALETKGG